MLKLVAAAALALAVSACGGPISPPGTETGRTQQAVEMSAVTPVTPLTPLPGLTGPVDIIDIVDTTDIVVTPKERLELVRTGRATFEGSHITMEFQRGSGGCGCGCGH